jgi:hypothetical protein
MNESKGRLFLGKTAQDMLRRFAETTPEDQKAPQDDTKAGTEPPPPDEAPPQK